MRKGRIGVNGTTIDLIDLPGTYSLAARSPDEMVAIDLLLGRREEEPRPDIILSIVDATNLDRHLYLTSQLLDLGVPVVVALSMIDAAEEQGIKVDHIKLSEHLGVPVVPIQANRGVGLRDLTRSLLSAASSEGAGGGPTFPDAFESEVRALRDYLSDEVTPFLTRRLLIDVGGYIERWLVGRNGEELLNRLTAARSRLADFGCAVPGIEARIRFGWIRAIVAATVDKPATRPITLTDKLDRLLTHRVWGTVVFLTLMFLVFQSIFLWAKPLMDMIDRAREAAAVGVESVIPSGPLQALLLDGVIKGVGSVLIFLPQILILFAFIAVLEDCGYMARAAFLMDRVMSRCGLSGKSFIPLLSSVACAVPGIMATRVIENRRNRLATILVAPLMSCSARLPVYVLLIAAFLTAGYASWVPGLVLFGMYMIGFVVAPLVALGLNRTLLRGETPVFVMELPSYRRPQLRAVLRRIYDAGKVFVVRAGTIILAAMVLVWSLLYFPHRDESGRPYSERIAEAEANAKTVEPRLGELTEKNLVSPEEETERDRLQVLTAEPARLNGEWKRNSLLGRFGRFLEPAFRPLGWDWKLGMAAIASFPAREVVVGTLGIIYDVGDVDSGAIGDEKADPEAKEKAQGLTKAVKEDWAKDPVRGPYGIAVAVSVMVFFALCCQCASTLAVIRRETGSWAWPTFTFAYMTLLAYVGAFAAFQIGALITDAMT
jgi:ferrous iron transport protein B